jgi:hypothetical protein
MVITHATLVNVPSATAKSPNQLTMACLPLPASFLIRVKAMPT